MEAVGSTQGARGAQRSPDLPILLAVCTIAPWPIVNGYALRVFHQLEQLSERWQIKLVAPPPMEGASNFPEGIAEYVPVELQGSGLSYPWRFDQTGLRAAVRAAVLKHSPHRALVWRGAEAIWMDASDLPPGVADMIDCTPLDLWRAMAARQSLRARMSKLKELAISAWFVRRTVHRFASVICAGEADARWMRRISGRSSVEVISNGVTLPDLEGGERLEGNVTGQPCLSFVGTLDFGPNVDAIEFLVRDIWPLVRSAYPRAELVIAGRNPTPAVGAHDGHSGIVVQANVPDIFGVLRRSQVSIAPMRSGVGVKNKVLEAWASGVPVVLTPLAVNGLTIPHGHDRLIRATASGLAQAVVDMFRDSAEARRLGASARQHVGDHYSWRLSASRIDALLRNAAPDHLHLDGPPSQVPEAGVRIKPPSTPVFNARERPVSLFGVEYAPLPKAPGSRPTLFVVVDTEAEFNWGQGFDRNHDKVEAMAAIGRGQAILERYGLRPVYVVDYPIASKAAGFGPLRSIHDRGGCEIGAHLHPWTNPPFEEVISIKNSFAGNLPRDLEDRKLTVLLEQIQRNLHVAPRFFKAGRYGVGPNTMQIIADHGISVDFSVMPGRDLTSQGGPDFRGFSATQYSLLSGRLVCMPMTRGPIGLLASRSGRLSRHSSSRTLQSMRIPGALARLGLLETVTLTPEGVPSAKQIALIRTMVAQGQHCFVLHYHSPSLIAGFTPYAQTQEEAGKIIHRLDAVCHYFFNELGGEPGDPRDLLPPTARTSAKLEIREPT
jgi:glycosyltransferase involved in cell wall biosynthesis